MEQRAIGSSGIKVSAIGLGCNNFGWTLDEDRSRTVLARALDKGITLLDTADIYGRGGSEEILGRFLKGQREKAIVITKFGLPMGDYMRQGDTSPAYIRAACDRSLQRLQTDYIDIYMMHKPDGVTPIEDVLGTLDELKTAGKIRHAAASNISAAQVAEGARIAQAKGYTPFIAAEEEYSLLVRDAEAKLPALAEHGLGLLPYFPLANGMLTGKYRKDGAVDADSRLARMPGVIGVHMTDRNFAIVGRLQAFAEARGHSLVELAFSWLLAHPAIPSVIAGATSPAQIDANTAAAGWKLTPDELTEIDAITKD